MHNLRRVEWDKPDAGFDWAQRFDDAVRGADGGRSFRDPGSPSIPILRSPSRRPIISSRCFTSRACRGVEGAMTPLVRATRWGRFR